LPYIPSPTFYTFCGYFNILFPLVYLGKKRREKLFQLSTPYSSVIVMNFHELLFFLNNILRDALEWSEKKN
jgi:hypothetical protein